ncbi:MAG: aldo/keto reductase [Chloroflexota bacterium]|nr:aldo/keto reductase [Chloroflexota bacterium]
MEYVPLGPTDEMIPSIGFGTARYHGEPGVLGRAIELGANLIDTAESYNAVGDEPGAAERIVCRELREAGASAFVATKVSAQNLRYDCVISHALASRERLGIDAIDLYQIHSPSETIPITETMRAMEQLVADGVIRYIGVSNFSVQQMADAQDALETSPLVSNQVPYSVLDRRIEAEVLPYCQANDITVIAFAPLALGRVVTGSDAEVVRQVAEASGKTPAQVAIRWLLDHDRVMAIPKTERPARVDELCGAAGWTLTADHRQMLDAIRV